MFRELLIAACILGMHAAAQAADVKLKGDFVGPGTYSPTTGCKKLEAIEKGAAAPNIATYPLKAHARRHARLGRRVRFHLHQRGETEHLRSQDAVFRRRG